MDIDARFHTASKMANMYDAFRYFRTHGRAVQIGVVGKNQFVQMRAVNLPSSNISSDYDGDNDHGR